MKNEWKIYFRVRDKEKLRKHKAGANLSLVNVEVSANYVEGILWNIMKECQRLDKNSNPQG